MLHFWIGKHFIGHHEFVSTCYKKTRKLQPEIIVWNLMAFKHTETKLYSFVYTLCQVNMRLCITNDINMVKFIQFTVLTLLELGCILFNCIFHLTCHPSLVRNKKIEGGIENNFSAIGWQTNMMLNILHRKQNVIYICYVTFCFDKPARVVGGGLFYRGFFSRFFLSKRRQS